MEQQNSFNLDVAIDNYVAKANSNLDLENDDTIELSDHLRSATEEISITHKLSIKEAFLLATSRLGHPNELQEAFATADGWSRFVRLSIVGILFYTLVRMTYLLAMSLTYVSFIFDELLGHMGMSSNEVYATSIIQLITFIFLAVIGIRLFRKTIKRSSKHQLHAIIVLLFIMLPIEIVLMIYPIASISDSIESFLFFGLFNSSFLYISCTLTLLITTLSFKQKNRRLSAA